MPSSTNKAGSGAPDGGGAARPNAAPDRPRTTRAVRYGAMGWVGEFSHKAGLVIPCNHKVVLQSDRGIEIGEMLGACSHGYELTVPREALRAYVKNSGPEFCQQRAGRILRVATEQDTNDQKHLDSHIRDDIAFCAEQASALSLDMKIVTAERLLGGERIIFYFGALGRIDFRDLVKNLAFRYRTRIEMRQVGSRDEARLVADYEICGRECCCRGFLKKLQAVNMRMAKLQKSTLDPSKVSGRCGRLRCCLRYEHVVYEDMSKKLPRIGSRVEIEVGTGTVIDRHIITQLVRVRTDTGSVETVPLETIKAFNLPPAPPRPVEPPPVRPPPRPTRTGQVKASPKKKEAPKETPEKTPTGESSRRGRRRRGRRRGPAGEAPSAEPTTTAKPDGGASPPSKEAAPTGQAGGENGADKPTESEAQSKRRRRRGRGRRPRPRGKQSGTDSPPAAGQDSGNSDS